ncbi:Transmembrane protein 94 [Nymphon striatum]|nr:Transmembrane protein 94 [Nymphon striatum]
MAVSVRGLSTKIALSILADRIIREIIVYKEEKKGSLSSLYWLKDSFHHANKKSILHWPSIVFILFAAAAAFICHFVEEETELKSSLAVEFFVLILLLSLNICVVGLDSYLRYNEIVTAIQNIVKKIKDSINDVQWKPENYPDLELPLSPAINLQWTYRDGSLVNLPWSLLVKGDVIVLHPGHKAPADCISYQADGNLADGVRLDRDEVYSPEIEGGGKEPINAPKARKPLPVQQFILIETPYIHNISKKYISIALFEIVLVVAMVLGVIAEHSLPLSMAPVLIGLSKKLAKDSKALTKLSLDRTTAAYKLRFGLADTMLARTIENIKQVPFSLNMDESTSKNLLRVFTILVSYYSDSSHEVVVEHLASVSLIKVASAPLFEQITGLFDKYNLPWENLMSVLMDSCNVMRGSKTGLEVRLREKASHLLDIDGDSCHHIHNCSKKFCEPFEKAVEKLHTDIYNDFKWSADLMDALKEICMILEVKFTKPDRFLGHRWLSCYDVTLANLRLMDAYLMFYYSFIPKESKPLYHHVVVSIFHSKEASNQSRMRIRVIQEELSRKSLTEDGRKRKNRIVEKLFYKRKQIITILHFYSAVLAMLKQYVCLFELKKPMIHKLYDRQAELFQEFLGLFIKPEELEHKTLKQLKEMDIDKADLLSKKSMFIGFSTEKALQQLDEISAGQFLTKAQTAFKACAGYMQKKLPLTNATLRRLSAIDPTAVGHSLTLLHLKKLPKTFPTVLNMSERQSYDREVHAFQLDCNLPPAYHLDETPVQLDHWWRDVIKMGKYPALTKMAKAIMSCFHGPLVESSFNLMQDILDTRSGRMKIETFNAFQTVKYSITAQKKSSLELFDRQDILRDPVNTTLCNNLQESWKRYKEEKENKRKVIEQKKAAYALKAAKLESKQKSKVAQQLVEKKARMAFIQKRQNNLKRKANLEALVANKKAKRTSQVEDSEFFYQLCFLFHRLALSKSLDRPPSMFEKELFIIRNKYLEYIVTPLLIVIVLGVNIVRYFYWKTSMSTWTTSILLQPFHVVLPLLPLKFAICYTFLNLYGITRIIRFYYATEHGKIKPNLCDDGYCRDELLSVSKPTKRLSNFKFVKSLLFGQEIDEKFWLHRTSNIMHTLGSMTSLCCVDKKGLLSWPNPTAEKVFFFKNPSNTPDLSSNESLYQSSSSISQIEKQEPSKQLGHYGARLFPDDDHSVKTAPNYLENLTYPESKVEVLDITHNNRLPFALQFDDSHWKQYLNSLKPLGLNILLNTCNAKSQPQYINFCSHLAREALSNEISVSVINRRCLCELSKQIGFVDHASEIFQFEQQLSFYRHVQEDIVRKDKLTRSLDVKKLKCAIPNAVSIVTRDTITGTPQLMSQGTADILIDLCSDYWDGNDIIPITQAEKKKILDFYHRNSLTAYCSAFAYRPITSPMSDQFSSVYVELPPDYYQLFHHSFSSTQIRSWEPIGKNNRLKNIHYLSSDSIFLHESSDQYSNDPEILLQPVCNQIFIGMVAMQYQARSDIVRLIEQLDEACIRFVHFSKENELRSRVFSEKMGLESGWNCHISLLGDKVGSQKSIFKQNMTSDISKKVSQSSIVKKEEITVENKLLSADLTKRFHRSHSAPVAVHYEFDAIQFSNSSSLENSFQNHTEKSSRDVSAIDHSSTASLECDVPFDSVNEHSQLLAGKGIQLRVSDVDNDTVAVLSLNETSETDSSDGGPVAFDMSNRAKLPKGIENIRPHLENIDNVPLLVSLFTDCTPDTTCEMIEIMQEHNEIICCIGSIANFHNMSVFLKSDVSIGVIPLYPQICMKKSVIENELPLSVMSPTKMGSMLNSFSCALTYHRDDPVDLYELIKEARHYLSTLKNSFRVMLYCCMTVTLLQLFAIFLLLPPILTGCQILWLTCVVIPVVSISTMASPSDSRIMFLATNKIVQKFDKQGECSFPEKSKAEIWNQTWNEFPILVDDMKKEFWQGSARHYSSH